MTEVDIWWTAYSLRRSTGGDHAQAVLVAVLESDPQTADLWADPAQRLAELRAQFEPPPPALDTDSEAGA